MAMKTIAIFILLLLSGSSLAGEIQDLYASLVKPPPAQAPQITTINNSYSGISQLPLNNFSPQIEHGIEEIGLERSRCYAGCPAYTFIIYSDGSFKYLGEYGVENIGEYTGNISLGQLNQVLNFINETDLFSFKDSYTSPYLDSATTYILLKQNGNLKIIENYANSGPATLWAIEQLIDSLLETSLWDEGGNDR